MRQIMMFTALAGLSASLAMPALADGKKDCTTAPQSEWKKQDEAEAAAKKAGYDVRRSKIEGQCYEVYGVKDGTMHELFYNPVDLSLMLTVKK